LNEDGHFVVSREPYWLIIHATQITADELVHIAYLVGAVK